ncbi:uncharacterized protein LOC123875307 [Maniola jurtina]|uniref:uncharacterized protein LOC123875307 n=1 Tax=Maniola jurtina TaxID=191418 RepID=UPI001E68D2F3|nr:uncharacterized protein LOC123875307 [Maniola jurtina]
MTNECKICKISVQVTQKRIKCIKCQLLYHFECIVPSGNKSPVARGQWICPHCQSSLPSISLESNLNENTTDSNDWLSDIRKELKEVISQTVSVELRKIREELSGLQTIKSSLDYLSSLFDTAKQELEDAKKEIIILKKSNSDPREIINSHTNTINILDKEARASNIELHCVPEFRGENLVKTVEQIGRVVNIPIAEGSLIKCTRVAKLNKESPRPRSVIVKFSSSLLRDKFLAGVINFNKANKDDKLNTTHLGISGEKKPVYISEHLSSTSKDIYAAARSFAKNKQYRFVWSRNGNNIFLRKTISSDILLVKSKEFLETLA